jgi:hypothetical protein
VNAPFRLPEPLPRGESAIWIGRPDWRGLALRAFHIRAVAIYFGLLALWRVASGVADGETVAASVLAALWVVVPGGAACALLALLAWLSARSTRYIITTRRVIMQFGVALPMTLNIPFSVIASAGLKSYRDGSGDIPLATTGPDRVAYLLLWPHARPWRAARAEPMLRSIPDAQRVAGILGRALAGASNVPAVPEQAEEHARDGAPKSSAAPQAAAAAA